MLRTLIAGAIAAFVGNKLVRMNEAGELEPYKARARATAADLKGRFEDWRAEQASAAAPSAPASPARAKAVRSAKAARAAH